MNNADMQTPPLKDSEDRKPRGDSGSAVDVVTIATGPDEEVSLYDLWRFFEEGRRWIFGMPLAGMCVAGLVAFVQVELYKGEVVIVSVAKSSATSGLLQRQLEQFLPISQLASSFSAGNDENVTLAILQSRPFLEKFIEEHATRRALFPDRWDRERGKWKKANASPLDHVRDAIDAVKNLFGSSDESRKTGDLGPTMTKSINYFRKEILNVDQDKNTSLVTVSLQRPDPEEAAKWANLLVDELNSYIRNQSIEGSKANIDFLEKRLLQTNIAQDRSMLLTLLQQEIQTLMMSQSPQPFVFKVIEPAVPGEEKSWPPRLLFVAAGLMVGLVLGVLFALGSKFHLFLKQQKTA